MIQESDEKIIREHLLGKLTEEELSLAEKRLLTDDDYFELLTIMEDELIDEYINDDLTDEDRKRFEAFFLYTPERREKLRFAQTLKEYVSQATTAEEIKPAPIHRPAWWKQPLSSPYLRLAAAAVIVIGLGLGIWRAFIYQPEASKGIAALNKAYSNQRPVESRITEFDYAPLPVTRGDEQENFDYVARDRAQALIQLEAAEHPNAQSYHDLGRLYLTQHEFDKAIDQFEKALKLDGNNAQIENDLGVALMEKGKAERLKDEGGNSLEYLARALEHFNKTLELNGSLLEALFNRALCRQEMGLFQQAEEDWRAYLEKDPNSRWADEARQKLKNIDEQKQKKISQSKEQILQGFLNAYETQDDEKAWNIIRQSREFLSGTIISEQLLDKYLETSAREQSSQANVGLRALSYIGELEAERTNDLYTSNLTEFYRSLSPGQTKTLTQARDLIKSGHAIYSRAKPLEAIGFYSQAKQLFDDARDEEESLFTEHWIGFCYREAGYTEKSLAVFEPLIQKCEQKNYKWLLMRSLLLLSSTQYNLNEYSKAIDYGHRSLNLAEQIGDTIGIFNALSVLIEEYRYINNHRQSLNCVQRSLSVIDSCPLNPIQIGRHYGIVASAFNSFGFYNAAIDYQKEMVRQASSMNHAQMTTMSYANLGLIYAKLGKLNEALENAQLACETAESNADETIRKHMIAYSSLQKAYIYREAGDWGKATDSYNECIRIYDSLDFRYYTYQAHKGRLSCYIAQGEDSLAKEEFQKTIGLAEKYRSKILEGDNRNNFFEIEQSVYDLAIDFEHSRMNNHERAYEYSEASRARSLLDLMNASGRILVKNGVPDTDFAVAYRPLSLEDIKRDMPEQAQIIQYAVLDNNLFIWFISKRDFWPVKEAITQKKLTEKCRRYLDMISSPSGSSSDDERSLAKELFGLLIKPVESFLDKDKQLCIVADKVLNYLPFGALISSSDKYLVEEYKLSSSPSSSVFISCSQRASHNNERKSERLLSIGNPSFDKKAFPLLKNLSSAAKEAEQIAEYYDGSGVSLIGSNVRKARVMDEMNKADVIHFALHSVADPRSPMRSKLLLAKEDASAKETEAVLEAYELYGLKLTRARLVVLSACETGIDRYYPGEGMLNIARPFLVAGVPLTIASLWPVESSLTAELMVRFHMHRKKDPLSTVDALREAQLDMLRSGQEQLQRPYCWAPFIAIGGYATF